MTKLGEMRHPPHCENLVSLKWPKTLTENLKYTEFSGTTIPPAIRAWGLGTDPLKKNKK